VLSHIPTIISKFAAQKYYIHFPYLWQKR